MRKFLSISLMLCILLSSLGQSVIFFHYLLNKNYYATVLCENKSKPKMHCNGKCHMMKEMKEQEKNEQSPVSPLKEKQENVQFFQTALTYIFIAEENNPDKVFFYFDKPLQSFSAAIFHPPTC